MCMFQAALPGVRGGVLYFAVMAWDGMSMREARCVMSGFEWDEVGLWGGVCDVVTCPNLHNLCPGR